MTKFSHQTLQHKEEERIILPIFRKFGLSIESADFKDSPDVRFVLPDGTRIGAEITQYISSQNKQISAAIDDVLLDYNAHLSSLTSLRYQVNVCFRWKTPREMKNLKKHKDQIFKEIDSFIPGHLKLENLEFIEYAHFYHFQDLDNFTGQMGAWWDEQIDEDQIVKTISKKESKLAQYKQNVNNVDEFWLVIYADYSERTDITQYVPNKVIKSGFDHIYLCEASSDTVIQII